MCRLSRNPGILNLLWVLRIVYLYTNCSFHNTSVMSNENSTQGLVSTLSFTSAYSMGSARATQSQNDIQRGWNTFVIKDIRFQTVSPSASRQILRQYFKEDRHWFFPSSLPVTFPSCWHNRLAKGFDVKELVHAHSPKHFFISRHISNVHNIGHIA